MLVETKYEFGKASDGTALLINEVHTPDSSRYWIAHSYLEHFWNGLEPKNVDKEFLRLWFKDHYNPYEVEIRGIGKILEGLIPYSQRHFSRIDRLERSTFLLDYTLTGMSIVEPEIDQTNLGENDTKLSDEVEEQLPEAAALIEEEQE